MDFVSIIRIPRATVTIAVLWASFFTVTVLPANGQEASSEAPDSHNEYLDADGGLNLFTGTATLRRILYRLPAGNGFGHDIALTYSSNVQMQARAKNDIGATGWVGLGWRLNPGAIIRVDPSSSISDYSNKSGAFNARTRFYWITPEGGKKRLRPTPTEKLTTSHPTFFIEDAPYWKVTYDLGQGDVDSWTLVSPEGIKYEYGEIHSGHSSRRLAYGHLFGKGANSKPNAYQWDLVRIDDGYGNKVDFWWDLDNQAVKLGGTIASEKYTRAAYLSRITTSSGWSAYFYREKKSEKEYLDPWTSSEEPDIYQEKYETDRLSKVEIKSPMGEIARTFAFSYKSVSIKPQFAFAKSLLWKIIEKNFGGNEQPHMKMVYYVDIEKADLQQENYNFGALKSVKFPEGRQIEYEYARAEGPAGWNPKAFEVYSEEALDFNLHLGQLDDGSEVWYINAYNTESQWVQIRRWNGVENEIIGNLELDDNSFAVNAIDNGCLLRSHDVPLLYAATWHWGDYENGPGFQYRLVYEMEEEHLFDNPGYWSYHMRYAANPSTNVFVLRTEWKDGSIFYLPYYWDGQHFYNRANWKGTDPIGAGSVADNSKPFFVCGDGYMVIYHLNSSCSRAEK